MVEGDKCYMKKFLNHGMPHAILFTKICAFSETVLLEKQDISLSLYISSSRSL